MKPIRKKITQKELKAFLRSKNCERPHNVFIAEELFEDPNHPITQLDKDSFSLRHIYNYIDLIDDDQSNV